MGALPITARPSPGPRRRCPGSRAPIPTHLWPSIFSTRGVGACSGVRVTGRLGPWLGSVRVCGDSPGLGLAAWAGAKGSWGPWFKNYHEFHREGRGAPNQRGLRVASWPCRRGRPGRGCQPPWLGRSRVLWGQGWSLGPDGAAQRPRACLWVPSHHPEPRRSGPSLSLSFY